ncbi:MAG: alpha/beta fold hydrolase [Pseudomonadota bacterium]
MEPRSIPPTALADWIAAQEALLASETPDWDSCARLIAASEAVSRGVSPFSIPAPLEAFPFPLERPKQTDTGPAWGRFIEADQALKLILAEGWIAAARQCSNAENAPEDLMRRWAEALDDAVEAVVASERYGKILVEWLRAGIAVKLPMRPPNLPVPPAPPLATTPREIVSQMGRVTLSRYEGPQAGVPLLIVHGLIGRQSVCDLEPDRSLIASLISLGHDVWVIDWGNPGPEDRNLGFTDHIEGWLARACETVAAVTHTAPALMGICQGGLFVLCYAALHPAAVSGLVLTGTPVDFHADRDEPGYLNRLARLLPRDVIEGLLAPDGLLPGATTGALFQAMTPGRTFAKYTIDLAAKLAKPAEIATFSRMEAWLADRPDLPGGVAREWLIDLYQKNLLIQDKFEVGDQTVTLASIEAPILNIIAKKDHIVPPACSHALAAHAPNSRYRAVEVPSGHIGVFVSEAARQHVAPAISDWLSAL